ncbi:MAG: SufE family protein [Phycisphaeraceae bacterium]|nr:SufE family protein [Phycisphaeraceae bacterium]
MSNVTETTLEELIEGFELLDDWESRFGYLLDLGKKLPPMDPADQTEANRVHGCQATVWMVGRFEGDPPRLNISAASDAHIVNGLIAILMILYNGRTAEEAAKLDPKPILAKLDLEEHLSPTRRNGLHAMVKRIRELSAQEKTDA